MQEVKQNKNTVLLGDEGYSLEPWFITPYRNPTQAKQTSYNKLLKK